VFCHGELMLKGSRPSGFAFKECIVKGLGWKSDACELADFQQGK
jgi:hypothetical protein